jgi:flagellar basal body-associated protein FliL
MDKKTVLPIAGATMMAGAAIGMMMMPKKKKQSAQKAAGKAIKAVGEVVEHLDRSLKM